MRRFALLVAVPLALAGCAGQPFTSHYADALPGFWWGLLHGFIAPFSLIGSFFNPEICAYAAPNVGWWYDLGFVLGIGGLTGGARG